MSRYRLRLISLAALLASGSLAEAQIAISANDNKVVRVNGAIQVVPHAPPDTATIIDLKASPPRVIAEVAVPASVSGPPLSVAITPDERLALVTAAMKVDPNDPTKTVPDNRMSVIDLKAKSPKVIAALETGKAPSGISINRQGNLALVANRGDGTVSIFTIRGKTVTPAGKVILGDEKSGPSHVAIAPDGRMALVTRGGDDRISILSIDGVKVEYTKRDLYAGLRPNGIDVAPSGAFAVVANIGWGSRGGGDNDTISLIDLRAQPPRVVETVTAAPTPEGIKLSPDGSIVAVVAQNGSNKATESPFYRDNGKLILFRVSGMSLSKAAEAPIGHWSQGVAFSADGRTILVGNMVEKDIQVFEWDGTTLRDTGHRIKVNGGSAALRTADK
jgi:DNA-binding beta-propeller fold protein YncE